MQRNSDSRNGTGGGRSSNRERMTREQFKNLHALKNKDLKGEVIKCDKGLLLILVFDRYFIDEEKFIVSGPECVVLKYNVDDDLKARFPLKAMLQKGTKVVVDCPPKGLFCEKKSLRLDVETSSTDEKPPGAKSENLEPEETKKLKKKSSKSPSGERDKDRVVKNVSARVLEVSNKDVVLCFQAEGHGDKEPITLQNDLELDITLYGRKSPEVFKIEDVKDKFVVGDKLKMNARKKNNVWHVQELIWPNWKDSKECETIPLTPIPEEPNKDVDTVDNVEPLRKETSALLQQFVSTDLVNAALASANIAESSASVELKEETKAKAAPKIAVETAEEKKLDQLDSEINTKQLARSPLTTLVEQSEEAIGQVEVVDVVELAVDMIPIKEEIPVQVAATHEVIPQMKSNIIITELDSGIEDAKAVHEEAAGISTEEVGADQMTPEVGMFCRGVYKEDGLEYEGIVKSIESTDDGQYAVVQFIGYGNEEPIWFQELLKSKGDEARQKQTKEALGEDAKEPIEESKEALGEDAKESVEEDIPKAGWFCRGVYKEDGLEYEGIVKSIESTNVGPYAVVQFLGYGNEQPIWFKDLLKSKGDEARQKQMKEAHVGDQDEISVEKVIDEQAILEEPINIDVKKEILLVGADSNPNEGEMNVVEIVNVNKETEMKSNDTEVVVAPKETNSPQDELQEDLTNNQPAEVTVTKNIIEENQVVDQMNVVVDKAITKPEEPLVLIKPEAFTMTKLEDQPALVIETKNDVIEDPVNIISDEAIAKLEEAIVLLKSDSLKAKGCKECLGFMKFIVAKKATELHDAVPEQVWKELSGKFN